MRDLNQNELTQVYGAGRCGGPHGHGSKSHKSKSHKSRSHRSSGRCR